MKKYLLLISLCLLMIGCHKKEATAPIFEATSTHAKYLRILDNENYQTVEILDPWKPGELLGRYYLVREDTISTPSDGIRLRIPLNRIATTSATQLGFLHALQESHRIVAMTTPHLIYNKPQQAIIDLGDDYDLQIEKLLQAQPDVLILTAYPQPLANIDRIQQSNIPILNVVEWMEQDPMTRAAWIQLYGILTDTQAQADSILQASYQAYVQAIEYATSSQETIQLATGQSFRGTWYVPTAATYMGRLIHDAGAQYAYLNDTTPNSLPLTIEQAISTFSEADVWIGVNANSMEELLELDEKHSWLKAYRNKNVYNFSRRTTPDGGNDFWETGVVHPDYILTDIIYALQQSGKHTSEIPNSYTPHFIKRLE